MQGGIALAAEHIQSPDQLKAAVKRLFQAHAAAEGSQPKGTAGVGAAGGAGAGDGTQAAAGEAAQR